MNSKTLIGTSFAAVVATLILAFPLGLAEAMGDVLTIVSSDVKEKNGKVWAKITTDGKIRKADGAFGYLVGTTGDHFIAVTKHPGVLDSVKQRGNIDSARWHVHYARAGEIDACKDVDPAGLGITDLSYESPGHVFVVGKKIIFHVPLASGEVLHFGLAPNALGTYTTGSPDGSAAAFALVPIFGPGGLEAVCVNFPPLDD